MWGIVMRGVFEVLVLSCGMIWVRCSVLGGEMSRDLDESVTWSRWLEKL